MDDLEKTLGNSGKLAKKWRLPGEDINALVDGGGILEAHLHFDPSSFQVYTRVPYLPAGELLVAPSSKAGLKDLRTRAEAALKKLALEQRDDADESRDWTRIIRVSYAFPARAVPNWKGDSYGRRNQIDDWNMAGWYEPRKTSITQAVPRREAEKRGHVLTKSDRRGSTVSMVRDEENSAGRGSDILGPLMISRLEVNYDPEWFDYHDPNGSMVGSQDPRNPLVHYREWQIDYEARLALWEAGARRTVSDQKDRPKRQRNSSNSEPYGRMMPWSLALWADLLGFQETIRTVDRKLRRMLIHADEQVLVGVLGGGRLLT